MREEAAPPIKPAVCMKSGDIKMKRNSGQYIQHQSSLYLLNYKKIQTNRGILS